LILTVTLNAAIDKTYRVEGFKLDRVHRPAETRIAAGGKGINVARVFQTLGGRAKATGFLGGHNGRFIAESLKQEGIEADFVRTREESRVCIAVVDPLTAAQTEVNENGPEVSGRELAALQQKFEFLVRERPWSFVSLSGSTPPGVPDSIYADFIGIAQRAGVRAVLDASGEPLRHGLEARPWMVKPNIHELSYLITRTPQSDAEIAEAAQEICREGAEIVAVTRGAAGAMFATANEAWSAIPPRMDFVSAVGSGDSFMAGFLWSLDQSTEMAEAFRIAVAAGAANAATYGAGFVDREYVMSLAKQVRLERIETGKKDRYAGIS
jgi:1-phosphofructokinase family hexose kinase